MKTLQEIKEKVAHEKGIESWLMAGYQDKREMLWPEVLKRACEESIKATLEIPKSVKSIHSDEFIITEILIKLYSTK